MGLCSVLQMMTAPGQTIGVSVFVDPMMSTLDLSRSEVSAAYLVGTLAGALGLPPIGRILDRRGPRRATTLVGMVFGALLVAMAGVQGAVTLAVGFAGIRMLGQGGLTVIATTAPARWFDRRRGLALGVTTSTGAAAMAVLPLVSTAVILRHGWRIAWLVLAAAVWLVVVGIGRWGLIDDPHDIGQEVDGASPRAGVPQGRDGGREDVGRSLTSAQAMRTPIFWAITSAVVTGSLITTALMFHQISLLGEQGLTPLEAAANFLPQTLAGLLVTVGAGSLIDKVRQRFLLVAMMALLAASMVAVTVVKPGLLAVAYGVILGAAQGAIRSVESASYPKLFGVAHAGEIRGVSRAFVVAGSAFGPLLLSVGFQMTGSYQQVLLGLLVLPVASSILGLWAPEQVHR